MTNSAAALVLSTLTNQEEAYYVCSIEDMYHVNGVQVTFGYNQANAPAKWSACAPDALVNEQLNYCFDLDLNELLVLVDAKEITVEDAKQMLMESIGDTINFGQLTNVAAL